MDQQHLFIGYNPEMQKKVPAYHRLTGWILLAALLLGALGGAGLSARAAPMLQAATNVVISEFRTNGPNGGNDEFIDLYNPTTTDICIENWQLKVLTGSGNEAVRATIPSGVAIGAGSHFLIANSKGYSGDYDYSYTTGIVDSGGIAVFNDTNIRIDSVGMNATSIYAEGTYLTPLTGNQNRSYQRLIDGGTGIYIDKDDNFSDFQGIIPRTP
ncbi:MAG: lamin tail domain-containing protein, partial [Anaerolineae bacterium]|nr:lamin tail domain-containing protein [Anaerolineae bacterium]